MSKYEVVFELVANKFGLTPYGMRLGHCVSIGKGKDRKVVSPLAIVTVFLTRFRWDSPRVVAVAERLKKDRDGYEYYMRSYLASEYN